MPRVRVDNLGRIGVIKDTPATNLPPEAWTALQNARVTEGGVEKFYGEALTLNTESAALSVQPYWLAYAQSPANAFWLYLGANKVYVRDSADPFTDTNITRQSAGVDVNYSATEDVKWNGGMFGGVYIANNSFDVPQYWAAISAGTKMANLTNWDSARRAKVVRPYGRFLVALNLTVSATEYPHDVLWSHPADAGNIPSSWDETDTTKDCGRYSLSDSQGVLVDGLQLRDAFMIYKEDATWMMQLIGGVYVMKFTRVLKESGLLAANCVTHFKDNAEMHFVVGVDDIYVHNGQSAQSILNKKLRRWLFNNIDGTYYKRSFVVPYPTRQEIWFCFPESGQSQPTQALVWNWAENKFSQRDLCKITTTNGTRSTVATQGVVCVAAGVVSSSTSSGWSADSSSWDSDSSTWEQRTYSPLNYQLVSADRSGSKRLYNLDTTNQFDGTNFNVVFERTGLSIIGRDREGQPKNDNEVVKLLTELWPRFEGEAGAEIAIEVGTQMGPNDAVSWGTPFTFTIGSQKKINPYRSGKFLSFRFSWSSAYWVRLVDYEMQIEPCGIY